ncbi:excitatory amino acid transporter-like [Haliotis rufescens]|uniref:excitatory amino acid transporter-like n=1 Tax=Haliotis rufescens TaxID=6454 RepID=UPI00201EC2A6|nr:excitatory amino acid transporter-like [Haliotis rufescens]
MASGSQSKVTSSDVDDGAERGKSCVPKWFRQNLLVILTLIFGVGLGFLVGFTIRLADPTEEALMWLGLPGELYMRMLKATILPLIVSSVIAGTASLDPRSNGRISVLCLGYIIVTNAIGAAIAVIVSLIIKPGSNQEIAADMSKPDTKNLQTEDIFADLIRNLFPDNLVAAAFQQSQTKYHLVSERVITVNISGGIINETEAVYSQSLGVSSGTNILGLILACTVMGMAASKCEDIGKPFLKFFQSTCDVMIKVLRWIVWYTPIGVASLIASSVAKAKDIDTAFTSLGMFVLTVTVGMAIHQMILLPLAYFALTRKNPLAFLFSASRVWMTAFGPPSTAVSIPEQLRCLEEKNHISPKVTRFVVPFAATLNRDGSCLFITVTAMYIGQLEGHTDAGKIVMIAILATVGSLAIPSVPSASIVTLLILLSSLNIRAVNIGLILAVEWYTDRIRTTSNSMSCLLCAVFTYRFSAKLLSTQGPPGGDDAVSEVTVTMNNEKERSLNTKL